jgi:2-iminoacetate synthase ThiH
MNFSHDNTLNELAYKIEAGERLSFEDGMALFSTTDVPALGRLADTVRRRLHGRTTYYNVNRHFNPTNICYADCKFCGFFRTPREAAHRRRAEHEAALQILHRPPVVAESELPAATPEGLDDGRARPLRALLQDERRGRD